MIVQKERFKSDFGECIFLQEFIDIDFGETLFKHMWIEGTLFVDKVPRGLKLGSGFNLNRFFTEIKGRGIVERISWINYCELICIEFRSSDKFTIKRI